MQRDLWVAAAFLDVMWRQIVNRDDVDFTVSAPAGPPAVAGTITAELGAVNGLDDHCGWGRGKAAMNRSITASHCMARISSSAARACSRCSRTNIKQRPIRVVSVIVVAIADLSRHGKERPVGVIGAPPAIASSHRKRGPAHRHTARSRLPRAPV